MTGTVSVGGLVDQSADADLDRPGLSPLSSHNTQTASSREEVNLAKAHEAVTLHPSVHGHIAHNSA